MNYGKQMQGFTLIELMIGIALAAIVLTMAVPSFSTAIKNNKVVTTTNELITDINFARGEAVKRGKPVVLCRSASPANATPTCSGSANNWGTGWLVFVDTDADSSYDSASDILVRVGNPVDKILTLKTNATADQNLVYNPDGTTNEGGNTAIFAVCDDRGKDEGRQVQVNATGRPRLVAPVANSCDSPTA
jgi:type IV fimbrial biogenesis protein FimT